LRQTQTLNASVVLDEDVINVQDDERKKMSLSKQEKSKAKRLRRRGRRKKKRGGGGLFYKQTNKQTNKQDLSFASHASYIRNVREVNLKQASRAVTLLLVNEGMMNSSYSTSRTCLVEIDAVRSPCICLSKSYTS